jgi:chromosome segregation protein
VGKSNALEAVMWGLGEDDPMLLRCMSQTDLIFAGAPAGRPAEAAVVELTFESDSGDLHVHRSLTAFRDEFFSLNGVAYPDCAAFREALNSHGLGSARRNVIRQERLTDFFMQRPGEREDYLQSFITADSLPEVEAAFQEYLQALIPESRAAIVSSNGLSDVDIEVTFPDKGAKRGLLLSGGERAVAALALKLALFQKTPGPMYLFDEIEPALDWTRNHNMQELLKKLSADRQLIMITHFQSTIQMANTVHGVRIRPDGSSWLKFHFLMDERLFKVYKCC